MPSDSSPHSPAQGPVRDRRPPWRNSRWTWGLTPPYGRSLRILRLMDEVLRDPFQGIGKPEPLKHLDPGLWSRRITQEHRLVYLVEDDRITFLHARYRYDL